MARLERAVVRTCAGSRRRAEYRARPPLRYPRSRPRIGSIGGVGVAGPALVVGDEQLVDAHAPDEALVVALVAAVPVAVAQPPPEQPAEPARVPITGRVIDAVEAERYGIVARVWPASSYARELAAFIGELAEGPTQTYAAWKLAVNRSLLIELDAYTDYERRLANLVRATEDAKEGREAFREKRSPQFKGR